MRDLLNVLCACSYIKLTFEKVKEIELISIV